MIDQALDPTHWIVTEKSDQTVVEFVERVLKLMEPPRRVSDRRRDHRAAFPHLLTLTPIEDHSLSVAGEPVTVVGKHLAARGLDFYHTQPLTFKRAVVSFESDLALDTHFVVNLAWCRFLRPGWYDSGGRFTHIVRPEAEDLGTSTSIA